MRVEGKKKSTMEDEESQGKGFTRATSKAEEHQREGNVF